MEGCGNVSPVIIFYNEIKLNPVAVMGGCLYYLCQTVNLEYETGNKNHFEFSFCIETFITSKHFWLCGLKT